MTDDLHKRYDLFCKDAEDFLEYAGYGKNSENPKIIGKGLLAVFNTLATLHFPEDQEVSGTGPRGLIWSMHDAFDVKLKDQLSGSRALTQTVRYIIKHRPPIQIETDRRFRMRKRNVDKMYVPPNIKERYDRFCNDAEELLIYAGYKEDNAKLLIVGKALLSAFNALATLHFPDDKEINGEGPRGLIWDLYSVFPEKSNDLISGSLVLAVVVRLIIKYRPPLHIENDVKSFSKS